MDPYDASQEIAIELPGSAHAVHSHTSGVRSSTFAGRPAPARADGPQPQLSRAASPPGFCGQACRQTGAARRQRRGMGCASQALAAGRLHSGRPRRSHVGSESIADGGSDKPGAQGFHAPDPARGRPKEVPSFLDETRTRAEGEIAADRHCHQPGGGCRHRSR